MSYDQDNYEKGEVVSNFVKFNKVGDFIKGVLVDKYRPEQPDRFGKRDYKYSIKAYEGKWHDVDGSEIVANEGDIYKVGSKPAIDMQMANTVNGQKIMFKLAELRKSNKGQPAKIIDVLYPKDAEGRPILDQKWLEEEQQNQAFNPM